MGTPWSWNSTSFNPPSKFKISYSLCNPSVFFSVNRPHVIAFSSPLSSPSPSPSCALGAPNPDSGRRKPVKVDAPSSKSVRLRDGARNEAASVSPTAVGNRRRDPISLKSLFERRSLWQRALFTSKKVRSIILLNVITVVYASNIPVVKEVEAIMDPATFTVVRFAVTAIPFIPFVFQARRDSHTRNAGVELGFWVSLGYLMQAFGLLTSDAGRASFLSMLTVIVVPFLDGLLGAVIPTRTWFGALMSLLGVAMLESSGSPPCLGDLLNFLSAVFFGIHMLRTEHISRSTKKKNILALLGYEVCVVAFLSILWYLIGGWIFGTQEVDSTPLSWSMFINWVLSFPWIPALYTGVFSTTLCLWVEMTAMRDVSATETAIIYGLEPVWGGGLAWFLLGERWGLTGWIGAALVLGGSLSVQIFAVPSASKRHEVESNKKVDHLLNLHDKKRLSTTPIVVSSRKDVSDLFEK